MRKTRTPSKRTRLEGRGRVVPTRPTGIAYRVHHGIRPVIDGSSYGGKARSAQWTSCSVRLVQEGSIPNGSYFLYTDEGTVHQLKYVDGNWHYLAVTA